MEILTDKTFKVRDTREFWIKIDLEEHQKSILYIVADIGLTTKTMLVQGFFLKKTEASLLQGNSLEFLSKTKDEQ